VISWPPPFLPAIPGQGLPVRVFDTSAGVVRPLAPGPVARMYVCGITPYDATHLGHAATYVTFDLLGRALRDAGHDVVYVQNVTDIDEPLLERAERDSVDWQALAEKETALFREDMTALGIIPPDHFVGAVEAIPSIVTVVERLLASGTAYRVGVAHGEGEPGAADVYFDVATQPDFGTVSSWDRDQMMAVFADRGGDPDRAGKRDPLDPLLWRAAREGEPRWDGATLGAGRPGWHVECTTIALEHLGMTFDVQGGGSDLVFPHHEMSAVQATGLTGEQPFARSYVHQAMVSLHGEKMSKSKGNLVFVSALRDSGVDPMAIRLVLVDQHYRTPWEWTDDLLATAQERLGRWREALSVNAGPDAGATISRMRECLADDLFSPGAVEAVDRWAKESLARGGEDPAAPGLVARAIDALLGIRL
jgi:L-cysteine:1D-myo-inositol 2-amino-2-deoxy-alpha-D-glucopyranoside ligase